MDEWLPTSSNLEMDCETQVSLLKGASAMGSRNESVALELKGNPNRAHS